MVWSKVITQIAYLSLQYCFGDYLHKDSDSLNIRDTREKRVNEFRHKLENTNWDLSDLACLAGVKRGRGRGNLGARGRKESLQRRHCFLHFSHSDSERENSDRSELIFAAGHQPAADHILDPFEIFGSMVPWFDRHLWLQRCAVSDLLSCCACFSLRSNPPFCFALM